MADGLTVLHVSQPTDAGVARCVAAFAADQSRRGWSVHIACPPRGDLSGWGSATEAIIWPWAAERAPGASAFAEARRLRRIIEGAQPDVVHLHSSKAGLVGRTVIRGRKPTVFQPHAWSFEAVEGPTRALALRWERMAARWTHALVCVSKEEREVGEQMGIDAPFEVVPNGVDAGAITFASSTDREAARVLLELPDAPLAVCVGRLSRQKGQDALIEAWPEVRARVPDAILALVGGGPELESLKRLAGDGILLVGERSDALEWMSAANLIVMPSRWEGMSLAMLEAMARGRSIVSTDVGPAARILDRGGEVVAPDDPAALAVAVADRLLDPARADAEGSVGRRLVEQSHDLGVTTEKIANVYTKVLTERGSPTRTNSE